jgi:hypothetical protein
MLDNNAVDIDHAPIGDYGYNEMDVRVHGHGEEEVVVEVIGKGGSTKRKQKCTRDRKTTRNWKIES